MVTRSEALDGKANTIRCSIFRARNQINEILFLLITTNTMAACANTSVSVIHKFWLRSAKDREGAKLFLSIQFIIGNRKPLRLIFIHRHLNCDSSLSYKFFSIISLCARDFLEFTMRRHRMKKWIQVEPHLYLSYSNFFCRCCRWNKNI